MLGATLTCVAGPFPGADRAVVVRARRSDTEQTVIVKGYDRERAGEGWVREAAALTALAGSGTNAPEVVAVVASPPVVVMEDLGTGDSLATALLGLDPETAERALVEWAEALADLHAATWNDVSGFERALGKLAGATPVDPDAMPGVLADGVERLRRAADTVGVEFSEQVDDEIRLISALLGDDVRVVSPFDACPDNNVRTAAGLRLIDFEGATVAHPSSGRRLSARPVAVVLVRLAVAGCDPSCGLSRPGVSGSGSALRLAGLISTDRRCKPRSGWPPSCGL